MHHGRTMPPHVLVRSHREWPWGLVFFSDASTRDRPPPTGGPEVVVGTRYELISRISHTIDGEATAEVWLGGLPDDLRCVYSSVHEFPSGTLEVTDAAKESVKSSPIDPGPWDCRVYVDDDTNPLHVVLALTPSKPLTD